MKHDFLCQKKLTLTKELVDGKYYSSNVVEDHYVLLGEPNGIYFTHFVVEKGTGSNIAQKLYKKLMKLVWKRHCSYWS